MTSTAAVQIQVRVLPYGSDDGAISLPMGGGLHAWYGIVVDGVLERLTLAHMVAHRLSMEAVRRHAVDALWTELRTVTVHRDDESQAFRLLTDAPNMSASALALDGLWQSLADEVKGDLIVRVVSADDVRFCGTWEPEALARLLGGRVRRPLLRWTGRGWERFEGVANHFRRAA